MDKHRDHARHNRRRLSLALWLGVFLALRLPPLLNWAPTYDEPIYVGAAPHFLATGDDRTAAFLYHPPLGYYLMASFSPLLSSPLPSWAPDGPSSQVGLAVLHGSRLRLGNVPLSPRSVIIIYRLPVLLAGILVAWLAGHLSRRLAGPGAGWIAAWAVAVSPTLAAHGVLATTDLVAVLGALLLAAAFLRCADRSAQAPFRAAATFGAAVGLALITKHSLVFPVAAVLGMLLARRAFVPASRLPRPLLRATLGGGVAFLVLWAAYGFTFRPIADAARAPHGSSERLSRVTGIDAGTIDKVLRLTPIPAPAYFRSLGDAIMEKGQARDGSPWVAYLDGVWSTHGFLGYFPLAVLRKCPVAILLLFAAGILAAHALARHRLLDILVLACCFLPLFLGPVASRLNIGIRHIAPALAFLIVLGSAGASHLLSHRPRTGTLAICLAVVLLAIDWIPNLGQPLSFANAPSGGPSRLFRHLADSNLEIGQDLWAVRQWAEAEGVRHVYALLLSSPGSYERECERSSLFARLPPHATLKTWLESIPHHPQAGSARGCRVLALGESQLARDRCRPLWNVEPLRRIGATRIYLVP